MTRKLTIRFGLPMLFTFVSIICVILAGRVSQINAQARAMYELREVASFGTMSSFDDAMSGRNVSIWNDVTCATIAGKRVPSGELEGLRHFPRLAVIHVFNRLDEEHLGAFAKLHSLETVVFFSNMSDDPLVSSLRDARPQVDVRALGCDGFDTADISVYNSLEFDRFRYLVERAHEQSKD